MHRLRIAIITVIGTLLLTGCLHAKPTDIPVTIITIPTNTLPPVITSTPRFTATLPPTETPIPSPTLPVTDTDVPTAETDAAPTASLVPGIRGTVISTATLRGCANKTCANLDTLSTGTSLTVVGITEDKKWYNVRLDDQSEGWVAQNLINVPDATTVPVITSSQQTQTAQLTPTGTSSIRKAGKTEPGDVLAYCDIKGIAHKTFKQGTDITIVWSWFAKTAQEAQDHITNAQYDVRVDDKALDDYAKYQTPITRLSDGRYWVYWYVPLPDDLAQTGEHKVSFNLTWKAPINDGDQDYGPGTKTESNTGTCGFTIK